MKLKQSIYWGLIPGLITSCGGAYKDTLYEPFERIKFFRSAIISFFWYIIIDIYYKNDDVILKMGLASALERITVETYKAIGGKKPGKFLNCTCNDGNCVLHKDRNWIMDRIKSYSKQ